MRMKEQPKRKEYAKVSKAKSSRIKKKQPAKIKIYISINRKGKENFKVTKAKQSGIKMKQLKK